jgi:DNA-binding MarR family transcriptional regulator
MNATLKTELTDFKAQKNQMMGRLLSKSFRFLSDLAGGYLREKGYDSFRIGHLISLIHIDLDGSTINELAARAGITKQAVSKIVKELQETGYVDVEKHPGDARSVVVTISEKGARFMLDWRDCAARIDAEFSKILGTERLDTLKGLLFELVDHYEKQVDPYESAEALAQRAPWLDVLQNKPVAIHDPGDMTPEWASRVIKGQEKPS